jgi:hypothetical protein
MGAKKLAERSDYPDVTPAQGFVDVCQERNGAR